MDHALLVQLLLLVALPVLALVAVLLLLFLHVRGGKPVVASLDAFGVSVKLDTRYADHSNPESNR